MDIKENRFTDDIVITNEGDLDLIDGVNAVYQSIKYILSTPPKVAEVLKNTFFDATDYLGNLIDEQLMSAIKDSIELSITKSLKLPYFYFDVNVWKIDEYTVGIIVKTIDAEEEEEVRVIFDSNSGGITTFLYNKEA